MVAARTALAVMLAALIAVVSYPVAADAVPMEAASYDAKSAARLTADYVQAIRSAVSRNWMLPDGEAVFRCTVDIDQQPGGKVDKAMIAEPCDATEPVRRSLLTAIHRAEPLPYIGFEPVFRSALRLTFNRDLDP